MINPSPRGPDERQSAVRKLLAACRKLLLDQSLGAPKPVPRAPLPPDAAGSFRAAQQTGLRKHPRLRAAAWRRWPPFDRTLRPSARAGRRTEIELSPARAPSSPAGRHCLRRPATVPAPAVATASWNGVRVRCRAASASRSLRILTIPATRIRARGVVV